MGWLEARAQIAAVLGGVSITSPIEQTIARVYESPPGTFQDLPCFVIHPPAVEVSRSAGGLRRKTYTVRLRLLVTDADKDQASAIVDAYREAALDAFDSALALKGTADAVQGPRADEATSFEYTSGRYPGVDLFLTVQFTETRSFDS